MASIGLSAGSSTASGLIGITGTVSGSAVASAQSINPAIGPPEPRALVHSTDVYIVAPIINSCAVGSTTASSIVSGYTSVGINASIAGSSIASGYIATGVTGSIVPTSSANGIPEVIGSSVASSNAVALSASEISAIGSVISSSIANAKPGTPSIGSASSNSQVVGTLNANFIASGSIIVTSTATAIGLANFSSVASANATSVVSAVGALIFSAVATANGNSSGLAIGVSLVSSTANSNSTTSANAIGTEGRQIVGQSIGISTVAGDIRSAIIATGLSQAASNISAISKVIASSVGRSNSTASLTSKIAIAVTASIQGSSLVEARKLSDERRYMALLNQRRGIPKIGYETARSLELSGAQIIEPTAFEPDAATYRGKYYYNAVNNVLYMKVITRKQPGITVAHWQKVSQ